MRMLSREERWKYEAARELGLMEKLERVGYEFFYEDSSGSEPRDEIWR